MARRNVAVVLKESAAAWRDKEDWTGLYREVYEFGLTQRNPYHGGDPTMGKRPGGAKKTDRVFDSTLPNAITRLANRLQSELCRPGTRWAQLTPGPLLDPAIKEQAAEQLSSITAALFGALSLSNFDQTINEWFLELVGPGTAVMAVMEGTDSNPVEFLCVPQAQCAFREGPNGKIWGIYRNHRIMAALIDDMWPGAGAKLPAGYRDKIKKDPALEVGLKEALYYDRAGDLWYYDVILVEDESASAANNHRLVEREYKDGYFVVTRWLKAVGETHGRGPAVQVLADAKTLNKLKELLLMNASLAVKGVWLVDNAGVINPGTVSIRPGALIPVRKKDAISRLDVGGDLGLAQLIEADLRNSINAGMLNKSLPEEGGGVRSATEIVQRLKEIQMDLGAPLGRVITEGLIPILQLALGVLGRKGIVPQSAGRAIKLDNANIRVEMASPLVQVQNLQDVENVVQWAQVQLGTVGKEAFMLGCKVEDFGAFLAEKMNVPPQLVRPAPERAQIQKLVGAIMSQTGANPMAAANDVGGGVGGAGTVQPAAMAA